MFKNMSFIGLPSTSINLFGSSEPPRSHESVSPDSFGFKSSGTRTTNSRTNLPTSLTKPARTIMDGINFLINYNPLNLL